MYFETLGSVHILRWNKVRVELRVGSHSAIIPRPVQFGSKLRVCRCNLVLVTRPSPRLGPQSGQQPVQVHRRIYTCVPLPLRRWLPLSYNSGDTTDPPANRARVVRDAA